MRVGAARVSVIASIVCLGLTGHVPLARAQLDGKPHYNFYAFWREPPRPGIAGKIVLGLGGAYEDSIAGVARIHLPHGVELVSGDTLVRGFVGGEGLRWTINVRCESRTPLWITGEMSVNNQFLGVDEAEWKLKCVAAPESLEKPYSEEVRSELVRRGQRFRHGGLVLVPIDSSERVTQDELEELGEKAHALTSVSLLNRDMQPATVDTIPCIAFIRSNGSLMAMRLLGKRRDDPLLASLIENGLREKWSFKPSTLRGRRYNDWILLRVPLHGP
jgi:hypothetical protein